ncbi:MAG TPA: FKBP-type peptidyl-prolyl cis-trans isomerase [Nevskiaceae bacterium]
MSRYGRTLLVVGATVLLAACGQSASDTSHSTELKTEPQKFGYAVGYDIGQSMKEVGTMIDLKTVEEGIEDGVKGNKPKLDAQQREEIRSATLKKFQEQQVADRTKAATENATASEKFLAEKAKEPGVVTTASGLEYKVDRPGKGASPKPDDRVTVNYKGTLIDGTVFDSSCARGEPATFAVDQVIPGWVEGLQLMKPGAKYTFYIPAKLAYGERGAGNKIGPNQALIFEVELISVAPAQASSSAPAAAASSKPH